MPQGLGSRLQFTRKYAYVTHRLASKTTACAAGWLVSHVIAQKVEALLRQRMLARNLALDDYGVIYQRKMKVGKGELLGWGACLNCLLCTKPLDDRRGLTQPRQASQVRNSTCMASPVHCLSTSLTFFSKPSRIFTALVGQAMIGAVDKMQGHHKL